MRCPIGLDLNGWHDFACRDWSPEDPGQRLDIPVILDGGIRSVIVEHGQMRVAGPQAILSPIGRGRGWSEIGDPARRRLLCDHWATYTAGAPLPTLDADLQAAVAALSRGADQRVICLPDHGGMGERQQNRLIAALSGRRETRARLLWRPVAVVLGLLEQGAMPESGDGMRIACLIHGTDGIELQRLTLRRLPDHPGQVAPERAGPGTLCHPSLGLARILTHAADCVESANPALTERPAEKPRMAANLLFGDAASAGHEIIRRDNSNWLELRGPTPFTPGKLSPDSAPDLSDTDCVALLTPLAARHHTWLLRVLAPMLGGRLPIIASPDTAARGALAAARRIENGIPHYLDRLDQVSLIVLRHHEPVFDDLIPADAIVPGNREYLSEPITSMVWPAGKQEVLFFLRKGSGGIRRWSYKMPTGPTRDEKLEIRLRQTPAQGSATLSVTAPGWEALRRTPIRLDWEELPLDPRSETEILAALARPRPAVPQRVAYQADIGLWDGTLRQPGLGQALREFHTEDPSSLHCLAQVISGSYRHPDTYPMGPVFAISTDGALPVELDRATRQHFQETIEIIAGGLLRRIEDPRAGFTNNDALRCLTWTFAACPLAVQRAVIAAFDAAVAGRPHTLLEPAGGKTVVVHGLGRITTDERLIRTVLPKLVTALPNTAILAPLASLLSRPAVTPAILADMDFESIARRLQPILRAQNTARTFNINYKYAMMALAGLLRVRAYHPWALLADHSESARVLAHELKRAAELLERKSAGNRGPVEQKKLTLALIEYLETNEGRPDLLVAMDLS